MRNNHTPVITGAVALHRFAGMISGQYGRQGVLRIANDLFPEKTGR
jgi:hypothetical protein